MTPEINGISGIFDQQKTCRIELFYIEFIKGANNPDILKMIDLMSDFVTSLKRSSHIEKIIINKIKPVKCQLTSYGERAIYLELEILISDCEHSVD